MSQAEKILDFIEMNLPNHPKDIVDTTAKHFEVSRTTVHRHLAKLLNQHKVIKSGTTRDARYFLTNSFNRNMKFKITNTLDEARCYDDYFKNALSPFPDNVETICRYGFTEVFNNAIDHSYGTEVVALLSKDKSNIIITIEDNGIGVFKSIHDYFHLENIRESILQLTKGKMTTDPSNHTGEGIFFNSRAFDFFEIYCNNMHYLRDNIENDWSLSSHNTAGYGSKIVMTISANSKKDLMKIWKDYQDPETLEFDRTEITVELSKIKQEKLISRSQAKRILMGLGERFKTITLDFKGVTFVGQGFVDEIFRVFQNNHPDIQFKYINANEDVIFMIERGIVSRN